MIKKLFIFSCFVVQMFFLTVACSKEMKGYNTIVMPKANVDLCINELKHRISIDNKDLKEWGSIYDYKNPVRKSVYYGDMEVTKLDIFFDSKMNIETLGIGEKRLFNHLNKDEVKKALTECYDKKVEKSESLTVAVDIKKDGSINFDGVKDEKLMVCFVKVFKHIGENEIDGHFKFNAKFKREFDMAQSFEVALYWGYSDIARCLATYVEDMNDLSRMVSPAVRFGLF